MSVLYEVGCAVFDMGVFCHWQICVVRGEVSGRAVLAGVGADKAQHCGRV